VIVMFRFSLEGIAVPSNKLVSRLLAEKGVEVTENLERVADQFFELRDSYDGKRMVFLGTEEEIELFQKIQMGRTTLFICEQKDIEYTFEVVKLDTTTDARSAEDLSW
jgi:hypothetical protein